MKLKTLNKETRFMSGNVDLDGDIHSTGFTRRIDTIESVNIELATKLYDSY